MFDVLQEHTILFIAYVIPHVWCNCQKSTVVAVGVQQYVDCLLVVTPQQHVSTCMLRQQAADSVISLADLH